MNKSLLRSAVFCSVVTACGVILRIFQIKYMIEPSTGFFTENLVTFGSVVSVIIFVFAALAVIFAAFYKKVPVATPKLPKGFGIVSAVLAFCILYESVISPPEFVTEKWQLILMALFGAVAAAAFICTSLTSFDVLPQLPLLNAAPVIYWLIRIIVVFSAYTPVPTIADNVFELASLCAALVYFLYYAKFTNSIDSGKTNKAMLAVSVLAVVFCAVYSLPQLILIAFGNDIGVHSKPSSAVTDLAVMLFVLYYAVLCNKTANLKNKSEYLPDNE